MNTVSFWYHQVCLSSFSTIHRRESRNEQKRCTRYSNTSTVLILRDEQIKKLGVDICKEEEDEL